MVAAALAVARVATSIKEALAQVLALTPSRIRPIFLANRIALAAVVADIGTGRMTMAVAMVGQMEATAKALQLEEHLAITHMVANMAAEMAGSREVTAVLQGFTAAAVEPGGET